MPEHITSKMRGFAKFSIIICITHEDETASMTEDDDSDDNNPYY